MESTIEHLKPDFFIPGAAKSGTTTLHDLLNTHKDISMSNIKVKSVGAYQKEFMMYTNKKGEVYPSRSFGGNNWYGGFSDHLPVFLNFGWNN